MKHRFKRIIILLSTLAAVVLILGACGNRQKSSNTSAKTSKTITITDQAGKKVTVPKKINRIAVVGGIWPLPSVLAVFFNSANKIVTMPKPSMISAKNGLLSQLYPEITKASTKYNDGTNINTEELKKSKPDVVFYMAEDKQQGKALTNAGFNAVGISISKWHYNSIDTLNHWVSLLSKIFPKNDKAKLVKDYSNNMADMVTKRVAKISPDQKQRIMFVMQYDDSAINVDTKASFAHYWADAIGATNTADAIKSPSSAPVNMETIYKWNPQRIFLTNFNTAQPKDLYNNTIGHYDWSKVDAVENHQVSKMPLGMYRTFTPGIDTPITLLWLAKTTYPDQFKDISMTKETKDYYKKVFDVKLTDKQANAMFNPAANTGDVWVN